MGASYFQATRRFWSGSVSFRGRASRSEYWWQRLTDVVVVALVLWLVPAASGVPNDPDAAFQNTPGYLGIGQSVFGFFFGGVGLDGQRHAFVFLHGGPPAQWVLFIWFIATVIPNLALGFRRLHDRDMPGWLAFFGGLPLLDVVLLLVALLPSVPTGRRYDLKRRVTELPQELVNSV